MKQKITVLIALGLTCLLGFLAPHVLRQADSGQHALKITRVWMADMNPAAVKWLQKRSAAYEKETGKRIYLRSATQEEMQGAISGNEQAILPDLIISRVDGDKLAYLGYALIIRDDKADVSTPAPTGALFHPPTSSPNPFPTIAPTPDMTTLGAVLSPDHLSVSLPGIIPSAQTSAEFIAGKAHAALLTAGESHALPFGYQAFPVPGKEGAETISGQSFSKDGRDFALFLLTVPSQQALKNHGLYTVLPDLYLYDESDPLRMMIENSLK